jgi:predicted regulator of Ras-like GTPase activity (Roadblock/LC7/MglB family)
VTSAEPNKQTTSAEPNKQTTSAEPNKQAPSDVSRAPLDTARTDVQAELRSMRGASPHVEGSIVATTDGLVISHDLSQSETYGIEPEGVAALAAVNLGLSQRIADTASHGHLQETVVRGSFGQVITYPAGSRALLTVLVRAGADMEALHIRAREVAGRVADLLTDTWQDDAFRWRSP